MAKAGLAEREANRLIHPIRRRECVMPPTTRLSLIARINDPDDSASWGTFVGLYGPFIYEVGRKRGLQDADACDLVQEVMCEVAKSISRFEPDPNLGRFRGWLGVITRRTLSRYLRKNQRQANGAGGTAAMMAISSVADSTEEEAWEQEHQQYLFRWAAERVRGDFTATTWQAFWLSAVEDKPVKNIADQCNISVGAVYIAKSRVLNRIREHIQQATGT